MATAFFILLWVGILMHLIGCIKMVISSDSELGFFSFLLLLLFPVWVLLYLVRYYKMVRVGAFISLTGLWLTLPFTGHMLWRAEKAIKGWMKPMERQFEERMNRDDMDAEHMASMPPEALAYILEHRREKLGQREKFVSELNARSAAWHQLLSQKRASLPEGDENAVRAFNADAAAYAEFNKMAREENDALQKLRTLVAKK